MSDDAVSNQTTQQLLAYDFLGWDSPNDFSSAAIAAHWLGLLTLFPCTLILAFFTWQSKGPWYVFPLRSNSNSATWADTAGHNFDDAGPYIIGIGNYRKWDIIMIARRTAGMGSRGRVLRELC